MQSESASLSYFLFYVCAVFKKLPEYSHAFPLSMILHEALDSQSEWVHFHVFPPFPRMKCFLLTSFLLPWITKKTLPERVFTL